MIRDKQTGKELPYITTKKYCDWITHISLLWFKIKSKYHASGTYMIKRFELKYEPQTWNRIAKNKSYFCDADSGVTFTSSKKIKDIFYTNTKTDIIKLGKLLSNYYQSDLIAIVNRKTGEHLFILERGWIKSLGNRNIIVRV